MSIHTAYSLTEIPIGTCCSCGMVQSSPGTDGFWINGCTDKWACFECKYVGIRSVCQTENINL